MGQTPSPLRTTERSFPWVPGWLKAPGRRMVDIGPVKQKRFYVHISATSCVALHLPAQDAERSALGNKVFLDTLSWNDMAKIVTASTCSMLLSIALLEPRQCRYLKVHHPSTSENAIKRKHEKYMPNISQFGMGKLLLGMPHRLI